MENRKEKLENAVREFDKSKRSVGDYMDLFGVIVSVTRQGSGLVWSQVQEAIQLGLQEQSIDRHLTDMEKSILFRLVRGNYTELKNKQFIRNEDVYRKIEIIFNRNRGVELENMVFLDAEWHVLEPMVAVELIIEEYGEEQNKKSADELLAMKALQQKLALWVKETA